MRTILNMADPLLGLLAPQHAVHDTTWIHPVVEYQDGLLRFKHKAAMEDVGQRHVSFAGVSTYLLCRWSTYLVSFGFERFDCLLKVLCLGQDVVGVEGRDGEDTNAILCQTS